ncbi:kelch domain-containing protein 2 [Trichonephila inaurata madagascariensis]|uniref:Kelch domain-containing protein 2 n=1 Tax=Trichonephila inaurata madagascariensis TaxID=2747483 RepID=A0A8X6X3J7_9ARAC|nr:kelch domain-containing protein 2 [Trichonephila inaurata madagascariensis]
MILPFFKPRLWHSACLNVFDEILIYGGCTTNILDLERTPEQATDIIIISISPKSLYRLCLDRMLDLPEYCIFWSTLPRHIQTVLHLRIGYTPRKLIGS